MQNLTGFQNKLNELEFQILKNEQKMKTLNSDFTTSQKNVEEITKAEVENIVHENYEKIVQSSQSIVTNGLASQTILLSIFTFGFAVFGIFLARYVNNILTKITKKIEEVDNKLLEIEGKIEETEIIKKNIDDIKSKLEKDTSKIVLEVEEKTNEIKKIKSDIDDNMGEIYSKILEKETEYLINRLKQYPEDIGNLFSKLVTRTIDEKYYNDLLNIIFSFEVDGENLEKYLNYIIILYQQFPGNIFIEMEKDVWGEFIRYGSSILRSAFDKEIIENTEKLTKFFIYDREDLVNRYAEYLNILDKGGYLEENDKYLFKEIYKIFDNQDKKELFVEVCDTISLDYNDIIDDTEELD